MNNRRWKTKKEKRNRKIKITAAVLLIFLVIFAAFFFANRITAIEIEGNEYYTSGEKIPFIDTIEVDVVSMGKIKITVYEKGIVGMVEYLDNYMYFDKDGILVESSKKKIDGIPQITGLSFNNLALYEELPVDNPDVFNSILTLTQMLKKNDIWPDKIHFSDSLEITLSFDEAKVLLGTDENLEEKIMRLKYLMGDLQVRKGILHMENFNEDTKNITFENVS